MSPIKIKIEERGILYWNQYEYSVMFYQKEIGCARSLNVSAMMQSIQRRREWAQHRSGFGSHDNNRYSDEVVQDLEKTLEFLQGIKDHAKITFCSDWCYVYTSSADVVARVVNQTPNGGHYTAKQAAITHSADTVIISDPKFRFRTYFKERDVSPGRLETLRDWVAGQGPQISPSKVTRRWLNGYYNKWNANRCQRHFYIEHNDRQYETMMSLVVPGLIRKTVSVVARE